MEPWPPEFPDRKGLQQRLTNTTQLREIVRLEQPSCFSELFPDAYDELTLYHKPSRLFEREIL